MEVLDHRSECVNKGKILKIHNKRLKCSLGVRDIPARHNRKEKIVSDTIDIF
jgi:hypothetical protein